MAIQLGDAVKRALDAVGITQERVERWLGRKCGCKERREKLNRLGRWAMQAARAFLFGSKDEAKKQLERLIDEDGDSTVR